MTSYKTTGFQCPVTGEWVIARYYRKMVTLQAASDAIQPDTHNYCLRYTNKRAESLEEAYQYLHEVSDGQSEGLY
jgi:hypothetical protein